MYFDRHLGSWSFSTAGVGVATRRLRDDQGAPLILHCDVRVICTHDEKARRIAIVASRGGRREHMLILRPLEDCLVAHTMFYANEVRPAPHFELATEFSDKEVTMATALIKGYEGEFDPAQFKDLYQERIRKIIDAEVKSRIEMRPASARQVTGIPDLMEQIRLSLAEIESKKPCAMSPKKPVRKIAAVAKKKPQKVRA